MNKHEIVCRLKQYRWKYEEIKSEIINYRKLIDEIYSPIVAKVIDDIGIRSTTITGSTVENAAIRIEECDCRIRGLELQLFEEKQIIEQLILHLTESEKNIIRCRYLLGMRWTEISLCTNYSVQHCFRLHESGILSLTKR